MQNQRAFTPQRIRTLRQRLGLTQKQADKVLGCSPGTFAKFETPHSQPGAALTNTLLLLEEYPDGIWILKGQERPSNPKRISTPFEVTPTDIAAISPLRFADLLRRLLNAEALQHGLTHPRIHVAHNVNAPDGGEDGRISWREGPDHTPFLPGRRCRFQLKTGKFSPHQTRREVLASDNSAKPSIQSALEHGGHYILLCADSYTHTQIEKRLRAICEALELTGITAAQHRIRLLDGSQIADWVNAHPSIAVWLKEQLGQSVPGQFSTWYDWQRRREHEVPFVEDPRIDRIVRAIKDRMSERPSHLRIVGLSGIGKTRLCMKAMTRARADLAVGRPIQEFVMYASLSEITPQEAYHVVNRLSQSGGFAVVVLDDCDASAHRILMQKALQQGSDLLLITIHDDISSKPDADTIRVGEAPVAFIKALVDSVSSTLSVIDRHRIVRLAGGSTKAAIGIAEHAQSSQHLDNVEDDSLVLSYVCGNNSVNSEAVLKAAQLLAVFGPVKIENKSAGPKAAAAESEQEDHLSILTSIGDGISRDGLFAAIQSLLERGIAKMNEVYAMIQPSPIAQRLRERQWKRWSLRKWDQVLGGNMGWLLTFNAARRLAEISATEIAKRVSAYICRPDNVSVLANLDEFNNWSIVLESLAAINPRAVAGFIDRNWDRIQECEQDWSIDHALGKIAFRSDTFMEGARLLLQLAARGGQGSRAPHLLVELYSPELGNTEADGEARLLALDEAVSTDDQAQLAIVVKALAEACKHKWVFRSVLFEVQGSLRSMQPWRPQSRQEWSEYISGCVGLLGQLGARRDPVGEKARDEFGSLITSLFCAGFLDDIERVFNLAGVNHNWDTAVQPLRGILDRSLLSEVDDDRNRVRVLLEKVAPASRMERR